MRIPRPGKPELLITLACLVLGGLFLRSVAVDPEEHHAFDAQLARLGALDALLEADVLRARHGLSLHYDTLVNDLEALARTRDEVALPPSHLDTAARREYAEALAVYQVAARDQALLVERFKSENAALRNSLVYFPIAADDLSRNEREHHPVRELSAAMLTYLSGPGEAARNQVEKALERVAGAMTEPADPELERLIETVQIHAHNILERTPALNEIVQQITDTTTRQDARELHDTYRRGTRRAEIRALGFRWLLYLYATVMIACVAYALSALSRAKRKLEATNAALDGRVRERTQELSLANERLEAHTTELQALNVELGEQQAELENSRKQQLELRDRFLSHVSHELRTPLASIHQFLSLLEDQIAGTINAEQREFVELALKNANQLQAMIRDLMEVTRAESGKLRIDPRPTDIAALIEEARRSFAGKAEQKVIALSTAVAPNLRPVLADPTRVRQILNNLVENALKFTPHAGSISIDCAADPEFPGFVRVAVSDSGRGIAPAQAERIFERLHQVAGDDDAGRLGLGLGLTISQELVVRQGGRIWVESQLGHGSRFVFLLPVFALEDVVRPAVVEDGRLREHYGLVRVAPRLGRSEADAARGMLRATRGALRQLLFYPTDVILPQHDDDAIFVMVGTDAAGMAVLIERIRDFFAQPPASDGPRIAVCVTGRIESPSQADRALPLELGLERVARRVEELVREHSD